MTQETAQKRVKALQKGFLTKIEEHPVFQHLQPDLFNDIRKRVFRGTFAAYRLGVIGIDSVTKSADGPVSLSEYFFCWLTNADALKEVPPRMRAEVADLCLYVALEAYRIGAMVAVERA